MASLTLNHNSFGFDTSYLPCLINGVEGSGASHLSIVLAAELINQGSKLIFFTTYPMAKEQLRTLVAEDKLQEINSAADLDNISPAKSLLIESGNTELFNSCLSSIANLTDYVVFVKNIENYDGKFLQTLNGHAKLILSGIVEACSYKDQISEMNWTSKIDFSHAGLAKYESHFTSEAVQGVLRIN